MELEKSLDKINKSTKWKANLFVLKKKSTVLPQNVEALSNESASIIKGQQFKFVNNMKIFDSLNSFQSLVEDVSTSLQSAKDSCSDIRAGTPEGRQVGEPVGEPLSVKKTPPTTSKQEDGINVCVGDALKSCWVRSCVHLTDGSLLLADGNNNSLKLVRTSGITSTQVKTEQQPISVCCIGPQEVAVSIHLRTKQYQTHLLSNM